MKTRKSNFRFRYMIAKEAARLMYEENVKQYFDAKRMAAKNLFGKGGHKIQKYRPQDLPSNGEISAALSELAQLTEGDQQHRLFAMRVIALEIMEQLSPFRPRLIGSVSTGAVRLGSDIDIHVFTEDLHALTEHLTTMRWSFDAHTVNIRKNNLIQEYTHVYFEHHFPVELSVYDPLEIRTQTRSSTDGKPIKRIKTEVLRTMIFEQHFEAWHHYLSTGHLLGLQSDAQDHGY